MSQRVRRSRPRYTPSVRYVGKLYRPPSEADALILQATIGCSWNHCTYCDMYRDKTFRVRDLAESLADLEAAADSFGDRVEKLQAQEFLSATR